MLFCFSIYVSFFGKAGGKNLPDFFYPLRYFLMLMGFFAFFCGMIYNDFASIPLYLWGDSCYVYSEGQKTPDLKPDCIYPIGVDPSWYMANDELTYLNSMKMKIAVIFGVAQMSLGVVLKGLNALHFKSNVDFLFEFVP